MRPPSHRTYGVLVLLLACAGGGPASRPVHTPRADVRPVPEDVAQAEARKALKEKFSRDFADVSDAGKRRLADFLMREAASAVADGSIFVALSEARELACAVGEVELAMLAAGELGRKFDVDPESVRYASLTQCAARNLSPSQAAALSREAKSVAEARLAADDFEGARRAAMLAEEVSRRSGDPALQAELAVTSEDYQAMVRELPKFRDAMTKLEGDPADAAANQLAGEFLALRKQEWGRGLVMLTKGTDARLRVAAGVELSGSRGSELAGAAEAWAKLGDHRAGPARIACAQHARALYEKAVPDCSGVEKDAAIDRAGAMLNALPANTNLADLRPARAALGDERFGWVETARLGGASARATEKVNHADISWHPRIGPTGELPSIPGGTGGAKEARLTYRVDQLVIDATGREQVLQSAGKVTLPKDAAKPISLSAASRAEVRKLNAAKQSPDAMHIEVCLDGVKIYERVTVLPAKRAWWLDDRIAHKAEKTR